MTKIALWWWWWIESHFNSTGEFVSVEDVRLTLAIQID